MFHFVPRQLEGIVKHSPRGGDNSNNSLKVLTRAQVKTKKKLIRF